MHFNNLVISLLEANNALRTFLLSSSITLCPKLSTVVIAAMNLDAQRATGDYIHSVALLYVHEQHSLYIVVAAPLHLF